MAKQTARNNLLLQDAKSAVNGKIYKQCLAIMNSPGSIENRESATIEYLLLLVRPEFHAKYRAKYDEVRTLSITLCPVCNEPAHATESDDLDRHPECQPLAIAKAALYRLRHTGPYAGYGGSDAVGQHLLELRIAELEK